MGETIRSTLSLKNPYYISKERYLELKHFCLQYKEWCKEISTLRLVRSSTITGMPLHHNTGDPTGDVSVRLASLTKRIDVLKEAVDKLEPWISDYIFEAVTEKKTFEYFQTHGIACGRVYFYERYHEFFWFLDKVRE